MTLSPEGKAYSFKIEAKSVVCLNVLKWQLEKMKGWNTLESPLQFFLEVLFKNLKAACTAATMRCRPIKEQKGIQVEPEHSRILETYLKEVEERKHRPPTQGKKPARAKTSERFAPPSYKKACKILESVLEEYVGTHGDEHGDFILDDKGVIIIRDAFREACLPKNGGNAVEGGAAPAA